MNIIEVLVLAVIQAITEFVPVSSSGHLLAASDIFNLESTIGFDVMLHAGTLFALVYYFRSELVAILKNLSFNNTTIRNIVITTIPAVFVGFFLNDLLRTDTRTIGIVIAMLIIIGLIMINLDRLVPRPVTKKNAESLTKQEALRIGFLQAVALIPGTSRSGITIIGGRSIGMTDEESARYSFLVGIPIIAGAALYELLQADTRGYIEEFPFSVLLGITVAALVGIMVLEKLIDYVSDKGLAIFGWYRLALAAVLFIMWVN